MLGNIFRHSKYAEDDRPNPLTEYVHVSKTYLSNLFPDDDPIAIEQFLREMVVKNIKQPKAHVLEHPSYGNTDEKHVGLIAHTKKIGNNIIVPSGSVYCPPTVRVSPITKSMRKNVKLRGVHKHRMLDALARGDTLTADNENYQQSSVKIQNNSIPGGMKSPYNPLFDTPGYNAITSPARHSVMCGYAHAEKMIRGNLYITNIQDLINYCIIHQRACPDNVLDIVLKYNVYIPTIEDLYVFFEKSMRFYCRISTMKSKVLAFFETLPVAVRVFVFYANCLDNFLRFNEGLMRPWLDELFRTDMPTNQSLDPQKIGKGLEGDLLAMISAINYELIESKPLDEAKEQIPEKVQQLFTIGRHMESCLGNIQDLLKVFFQVEVDVPKASFHPNMVRKVVIVSDTDSVIFTTQSMVEWYCGRPCFTRQSYEINAFTVWMVSQTLEHVFARLSRGFGMVGDDIHGIRMKNEFLYPVFLRTYAPKHYAGVIHIQEGKRLPTPKKDIKGVGLRGSMLCSKTNSRTEQFLVRFLDRVYNQEDIKAEEVIGEVIAHEKEVYESLMRRETVYLKRASVKNEEDYEDPDKSYYASYAMWTEVFAPALGPFPIPSKGFALPVIGKGYGVRDPLWLERLREFDAPTHDRLLNYMANTKRKITAIVLPPALSKIPPILLPVLDIRKVVSTNGAPLYMALRSLGLSVANSEKGWIASDYHSTGVDLPLP